MHQPRIDFGMVLPAPKFGLEQFLEMTKALKQVEDKYKNSKTSQLPAETNWINQHWTQPEQRKSKA